MSMFRRKDPAALQAQLAAMKGGSSFSSDDKTEWKLKDDNGVGQAVIRFLPAKDDSQSSPFIKLVNHGFKKNGKWYIENCSSTHGDFDNCPVCQHLSKNDSYNTNKAEYNLLKRKTSFWANILVIKDPANPETEGGIYKFRFGQKIMDKINSMVEVDVSMGEVPVDVTCLFEGANFVLKTKKVSEYKNYDDCKFLAQSEIDGINTQAVQDKITAGMVDLSVLVAKSEFKDLATLTAKFGQVFGTAALGGAAAKASAQADALADELDAFDKDMADYDNKTSTPDSSSSDDEIDALLAGM
ncbi:single stranded DNA-binding protein,phage-associated [Yersinia phage phiR1-RT]|uniref:Single-stranded DNA-binding protein n=1 Tax=Yersinia phage phiR1-RT TaxID=1206558 RepID=I7K3B5_BPPR1|nr:single strand DNA binding protein [Yersinia phage phiR1-RT]CCI88816.1 single stranded DNA-binding protein,phage-associated [Yersinia phage phiR1-RT]